VTRLYGAKVQLQDLQITNIAALIATAQKASLQNQFGAAQLSQSSREQPVSVHPLRPSVIFGTAYGFYQDKIGDSVHTSIINATENGQGGRWMQGCFRMLYARLLQSEVDSWTTYWKDRLNMRGLNADTILQSLQRIPRNTPQGERWDLFRLHMNAWPTSSRLRFVAGVEELFCLLCGADRDSTEHLLCQCHVVKKIKKLAGLGNQEVDCRWAYFADADWGWPRTIAAQRLLVGSASLQVALADALCPQYVTEENFWNTKIYVTACSNAVMDLRTPLRMRGHGLDPELVDNAWFHEDRVALSRKTRVHTRVSLAEVKPPQPHVAQQLARDLLFKISMGREHFIATLGNDLIASLENRLTDKGVSVGQADAQCWTPENHYLQGVQDSQSINALMRINSVIVRLRLLRTRGLTFDNEDDIVTHGAQPYFNERLRGTRPTAYRLERKHGRLRPPDRRRGFNLYRSDGAARGQGSITVEHVGSGWGAVCFGDSGQDVTPSRVAWGWLGEDKTNNEAEYIGLLNALQHAREDGHQRVCFQLDSLLVVNQVRGVWACRTPCLEVYYSDASRMIEGMENAGAQIIVEHIYREYNKWADKCANVAVDTRLSQTWHAPQYCALPLGVCTTHHRGGMMNAPPTIADAAAHKSGTLATPLPDQNRRQYPRHHPRQRPRMPRLRPRQQRRKHSTVRWERNKWGLYDGRMLNCAPNILWLLW
jgi:ribonuclease HI